MTDTTADLIERLRAAGDVRAFIVARDPRAAFPIEVMIQALDLEDWTRRRTDRLRASKKFRIRG